MAAIIDHELMKKTNQLRILQTIRDYAPITRKAIQNKTEQSWGTISSVIKELLERKIIIEVGIVESIAGRKAINIDLNRKNNFVIGVRIGGNYVKSILMDIAGKEIADFRISLDPQAAKDKFLDKIYKSIDSVLLKGSISANIIAGIGVAAPGVVDRDAGICIYAPHHAKLKNIPLKDLIQEKYNSPCFVEHVNNCSVFGEKWFGHGKGKENFLTILLGAGISAGMMINNKIYSGNNNTAGEFGHICMVDDGPVCACGRKGCLEVYASGNAITEMGKDAIRKKENKKILELADNDIDAVSGETVYRAALEGDADAIAIFEQVGCYLGIGISNLINLINPETIILCGRVTNASKFFMPIVKKKIMEYGWSFASKDMKISKLPDAGLIGAGAVIFNEIYFNGLLL